LPVWRHEAQRQKEDELIWRGNQYVRAIRLYQMKMRTLPPSVDALVQGHFLRKAYKDPITKDDFDLLGPAATQPGLAPGQGQATPGRGVQTTMPISGVGTPQMSPTVPVGSSTPMTSPSAASNGMVPGGLTGVRSKSKDESIKIYQGRTHYNEWTFIFAGQQPGIGLPGVPGRGGVPGPIGPNGQPLGGPGRGEGGRGNGPGRGPIGPGVFGPNNPPGFPLPSPSPGRRGGGL